jgi:hypothetical protein
MDNTRGVLFITGTIITAFSIGNLASPAWGWLTAGCIILAAFFLECIAEIVLRYRRISGEELTK